MNNDRADLDRLFHNLSVQNFRPIRGELYRALDELKVAREKLEKIRALPRYEADMDAYLYVGADELDEILGRENFYPPTDCRHRSGCLTRTHCTNQGACKDEHMTDASMGD